LVVAVEATAALRAVLASVARAPCRPRSRTIEFDPNRTAMPMLETRQGPRRAPLAALAASVALLTAATPAAAGTPAPYTRARLVSYVATYRIAGATAGSETWQVHAAAGAGPSTVTLRLSIPGETETDVLTLAPVGLVPHVVRERLTAPSLTLAIRAAAIGGRLVERADVNGRAERVTFALGAGAYPNVELLVLLSATPLAPGQRFVLRDLVLKHAATVAVGVSVGGAVTVRTPAGTFHCLAVTLSTAGGEQTLDVATGPRPVLVRYANAKTRFTLQRLTR
jgi:hypothetical protein